jgi:hypothetical protein
VGRLVMPMGETVPLVWAVMSSMAYADNAHYPMGHS